MIFPTYIFMLAFLPIVLFGWYQLRSVHLRLTFLTLASYAFYGWWDYRFCVLILASTLLDFVCGLKIARAHTEGAQAVNALHLRRKFWLAASVTGNLAALGFFKYYNFFAESVHDTFALTGFDVSLPLLNVVLPLGISFYTFQSMSYTISVFNGTCKATPDFIRFAAFVSMFPQLVVGPIVRYPEMERQFDELSQRRSPYEGIADGVWLFVIGLVKKVWIADMLAPIVEATFDSGHPVQFFAAWAGTLCYTFQLYFDFSGYSDMARGLGLMLGFRLPINFDSPYKAGNPSDFWRRWHITLSEFLRDYLYIPLGGSRTTRAKTMRNIGITMFLAGLWHGAGWNFIVFGIYHGVLLIVHALWRGYSRIRISRPIAVLMMFLGFALSLVAFRTESLTGAGEILAAMFGLRGIEPLTYYSATLGLSFPAIYGQFGGLHGLAFLALVALAVFFAPNSQQLPKPRSIPVACCLASVVLVTLTTFMTESPFLYFQF